MHKILNNSQPTVTLAGKQIQAKVNTGADLNFIATKPVDGLPVHLKNNFKANVSKKYFKGVPLHFQSSLGISIFLSNL